MFSLRTKGTERTASHSDMRKNERLIGYLRPASRTKSGRSPYPDRPQGGIGSNEYCFA